MQLATKVKLSILLSFYSTVSKLAFKRGQSIDHQHTTSQNLIHSLSTSTQSKIMVQMLSLAFAAY